MKKFTLPIFLVIFLSCSDNSEDAASQSSNTTKTELDSTNQTDFNLNEVQFYRRSEPGGTIHTSEQIEKDNYWLYRSDQNLFSHPYMEEDSLIGTVKKGTKVKVLETESDHRINAEGFVGNPVLVQLPDGREGYMWNHYLVPMPFPIGKDDSEYTGIQWYLNHALYSAPKDSTIYKGETKGENYVDWEGKWENVTFNFEGGISYSETAYYESGEHVLFVPRLSVPKGYLILDALVDDVHMIDLTKGLPQDKKGEFEHEDYEMCFWSADVEFDEMFTIVKNVQFNLGDGCGRWYEVREVDGGIEIELGSGC